MRKEQITVTNNSVCNSAENKGLEGKGMKRRLLHFKKRMMLSRLVDTFFSRTSWTMLLYAGNHSISVA